MRLAALEMCAEASATGALDPAPDVIVATSLLSVPDLIGALPPEVRNRPVVLYMHENQAAYPVEHRTVPPDWDVQFALTNLASIVAADVTLWNSAWNHRSFVAGIERVLRHAPDGALRRTLPGRVCAGRVLWPPVEGPPDGGIRADDAAVGTRVVWPHRWEHDKGPDEFLAVAERLTEALDLRWIILGESFADMPAPLRSFRERFGRAIDHWGYAEDRDDYWAHLRRADWVLSTARHEFFGLAVVEALMTGGLPWLPDRLSYPELLPVNARGLSPSAPPEDVAAVRRSIREHLEPARAAGAVARLDAVLEEAASDS